MDLFQKFKEFVRTKRLPVDQGRTLLAVSGGVDSVVMANLFRDAGFAFAVAHCNFQLRGEESDQDEVFVQNLAADMQTPFFTKRFDTETYAQSNAISTQMAARELRYAWFLEIATTHAYTSIASAHHLNDSVETALLNFIRGTGLAGLTGISEDTRPGNSTIRLIRPLLFATRAEIADYAEKYRLPWREDSSNASVDYSRNFVRHRIVPLLEELNPNFLHTAERNLRRFSETELNIRHWINQYADPELNHLDKHKISRLPAPRQALYYLLEPYGFTDEQVRQVAENLQQPGLDLHSAAGWRLLIDRDRIVLTRPGETVGTSDPVQIEENDLMVSLKDGSRLVLAPAIPAAPFPDGRDSVIVDQEKLHFPLLLRPWRPGDVFQPFGMDGQHQKLQDFFTNLKLSRLEKEQVRVLENGDGKIIWIPGYRPDERFRVKPDTRNALKIAWIR